MRVPTHISCHVLSYDARQKDVWLGMLPEEECERLEGFKSEKRKREFLLGRAAARMLLSGRLHLPPAHIAIVPSAGGAPLVPDHPVHLSISHAGDRAAAAVSSAPVGIDIERIRECRPDLHRYFLHPDEHRLLDELPLDHNRAQLLCWTLKEAVLKGLCSGFRFSAKKLRLAIDMETTTAQIEIEGADTWHAGFEDLDSHFLAVAWGSSWGGGVVG